MLQKISTQSAPNVMTTDTMYRSYMLFLGLCLLTLSSCQNESVDVEVKQLTNGDIAIWVKQKSGEHFCVNFFKVDEHETIDGPAVRNLISEVYPVEPCARFVILKRDGEKFATPFSSFRFNKASFVSFDLLTTGGHPGTSKTISVDGEGIPADF